LKLLREDVGTFYRVRLVAEFASGRKVEYLYGPFTKRSKTKEIETRLSHWNRLLIPRAHWTPNTTCVKITYSVEKTPVIGWQTISASEYVTP
jgi:hypothetical protein